ncbi:glycosyltransferase [Candidatus Aminicenantes bacterium AH-873-B07]|nr:glycosyltransferase [Candidatus Aminicenantes bacterium AH-873-B07]
MNICVISFHSCPFSPLGLESSGGMNVYIKELSSALENFPKIKMDIFTRVQNKKLRGIKNISSQVRVIHLKGGPEYFISRRNLYKHIKEFEENLEKFICNERINYEIIYTHYWLSGLIGERIKNKFNIPLIHNYHSLAFMKKKAIKKGYRENANRLKAEKFLSFISDGIITSSNNEKENMLKEYKIPCWKLKVIYPGVNPNIFYLIDELKARKKLGFNHKDKIILYVGRIEPIKDLLTVVQAVELIKKIKSHFMKT